MLTEQSNDGDEASDNESLLSLTKRLLSETFAAKGIVEWMTRDKLRKFKDVMIA